MGTRSDAEANSVVSNCVAWEVELPVVNGLGNGSELGGSPDQFFRLKSGLPNSSVEPIGSSESGNVAAFHRCPSARFSYVGVALGPCREVVPRLAFADNLNLSCLKPVFLNITLTTSGVPSSCDFPIRLGSSPVMNH